MAWNDNLEGQALAIASSNENRIRVVAGPGSGKTFSLMRRIARLLESGVDPHSILLSTFTRTAAHDLKKRIDEVRCSRCRPSKGRNTSFLLFRYTYERCGAANYR
ncbi:MAG: UvrD-helicase domain-containing protein [Chitinophagaceae bacterium]|nr:UvrD-helicase domain-containing protein [Chitinophagaceae bacterium]